MKERPEFPISIYYDGACSVCAREIERYRTRDRQGRLVCIDISAPGFDPRQTGIPLDTLMYELHAIDRQGNVYRGVESFWAIWQAFPSDSIYGFIGWSIHLPLINGLARLCYRGFARIRKYLPKRKTDCDSGSCRISRH